MKRLLTVWIDIDVVDEQGARRVAEQIEAGIHTLIMEPDVKIEVDGWDLEE